MITIDAGVSEARFYEVGEVCDPHVVVASDVGTVEIPCAVLGGGVVVTFPGEMTRDWPAASGVATMTAVRDGERFEVGSEVVQVTRVTADRDAQRQAVADAVAHCEAYATSDPTAEEAIAFTKTNAAYTAWLGRLVLELDIA